MMIRLLAAVAITFSAAVGALKAWEQRIISETTVAEVFASIEKNKAATIGQTVGDCECNGVCCSCPE